MAACALSAFAAAADPPATSSPAPVSLPTPLGNSTLAPALKAAAQRENINLLGVVKGEMRAPTPGDAMVLWVGTSDDKSTKQWLIQLRRRTPTPKELRAGEGHGTKKYLSWGPVVTFESHAEALDVWMAGPVVSTAASLAAETAPAPIKRLRVRVPGDYLRLGLDNSARVDLRIRQLATAAERDNKPINLGHIFALDEPVNPASFAGAQPVAEQLGFTAEAARAWIGGHVALQAFYDMVNDVPELRQIAAVAIDRRPCGNSRSSRRARFSKVDSAGRPRARSIRPPWD